MINKWTVTNFMNKMYQIYLYSNIFLYPQKNNCITKWLGLYQNNPMHFRYSLIVTLFVLINFQSSAQNNSVDPEKGKFKKENMFFGSGINMGIAGNYFNIGLNPELGYSVTKWLDAGVTMNVNYVSQNATEFSTYSYKNFSYGAGGFLRIWPMNFIHLQVQPEYNWINSNVKNVINGYTSTEKHQAASLLVGLGYGTHILGSHYSYVTLMIDVLQDPQSPYRDQYNDPLPVFRAGFGMYLKPRR